jgi:hypothetical protein
MASTRIFSGCGSLPSSCTAWFSVVMNISLPLTSMRALTE